MARPAMPQEIVNANRVSIINAAMDMIRKTGISSVSARTLAQSIDINSALIYRYFSDIDEVILFACVHT
ncbi:MAG: helix-turn-helix transcriptional regulator, partial [Mogibacterium sp.]|nr:helix-turn-helix transcriptional regulator [Mogibacterium sp.]